MRGDVCHRTSGSGSATTGLTSAGHYIQRWALTQYIERLTTPDFATQYRIVLNEIQPVFPLQRIVSNAALPSFSLNQRHHFHPDPPGFILILAQAPLITLLLADAVNGWRYDFSSPTLTPLSHRPMASRW
jgi:hypothetical protein